MSLQGAHIFVCENNRNCLKKKLLQSFRNGNKWKKKMLIPSWRVHANAENEMKNVKIEK